MSDPIVQITSEGDGTYRAVLESFTGQVTKRLLLADAASASDEALADDEATARAAFEYLLVHQDAGDLPDRIEIGDVLAAYEDAVDEIRARRG